MTRVDLAILQEIVRVVQARTKVPDRVRIQKHDYQLTYIDDHRQRIEEALRRHDSDRLNMLFGQLASKVKYQLLRSAPAGPKVTRKATPRPKATRAKVTTEGRAARGRSTRTTRSAPATGGKRTRQR